MIFMAKYLGPGNFNRRVARAASAMIFGAAYGATSQNRDQPIQIEAASLEMRDKKKEATLSSNVKVVQGDTAMTSEKLVVFYEFELGAPPGCRAA